MRLTKVTTLIFPVVFFILLITAFPVSANDNVDDNTRPIDLLVVVDNSCSMFSAKDTVKYRCQYVGSDPDYLRIKGVQLILASLGFSESNESNYQIGVISLGTLDEIKTSKINAPLQAVKTGRDLLAKKIENPTASSETHLLAAIKEAYNLLRTSPNRKPENLPAVVVITDGTPYPELGQSTTDIENLIKDNKDIPLFIMLLENKEKPSQEYQAFESFWLSLQTRQSGVFAYRIESVEQIALRYKEILSKLQGMVGGPSVPIEKDKPLNFYVSQFVSKVVITIIHDNPEKKGQITVTDPSGKKVDFNEPGVLQFRGDYNPVEKIAIFEPRLSPALKDKNWKISSSENASVLFDYVGAYKVKFLDPLVDSQEIPDTYQARYPQPPDRDFVVRFQLLDQASGKVILAPQMIAGNVILPDGNTVDIKNALSVRPDLEGIYTLNFNFSREYAGIDKKSGSFIFNINAGLAEIRPGDKTAIASAQLKVAVQAIPYPESYVPEPLICEKGKPGSIQLKIGNSAMVTELQAQLGTFILTKVTLGEFNGDLTALCTPLLATCGPERNEALPLRLSGKYVDGTILTGTMYSLKVRIIPGECVTPSLAPTLTLTALPTLPPPVPTPTQIIPPPPPPCSGPDCLPAGGLWLIILLALVVIILGIIFVPRLWVSFVAQPPLAFIMVESGGIPSGEIKNSYIEGVRKGKNKVTMGSHKNDCIQIKDILPTEFTIIKKDKKVVIVNNLKGLERELDNRIQIVLNTSNPQVKLHASLNVTKIQ